MSSNIAAIWICLVWLHKGNNGNGSLHMNSGSMKKKEVHYVEAQESEKPSKFITVWATGSEANCYLTELKEKGFTEEMINTAAFSLGKQIVYQIIKLLHTIISL